MHLGSRYQRLAAIFATTALLASAGMAFADDPQPVDFTHNGVSEAPVAGAVFGSGPAAKTGARHLHHRDVDSRQRQHRLRADRGSAQRIVDRGQPDRRGAT